jgi:hypothetical protein
VLIAILVFVLLAPLAALIALRLADAHADRTEAARLIATQPSAPARFDPAMVAMLPDPARRFFEQAIRPGTPLYRVAELEMAGRFGMGGKARPGYMAMTARQVLAAPNGFVWRMAAGRGVLRISGSDSGYWTRFRIAGLVPVARLGGDDDHRRSAFGRAVAEAVFWTPAALLPGPGVEWQPVDETTARVTVSKGDMSQAVDVTVDAQGRASQVAFARWSNANPDRRWQLQPFGGYLSEYRDFDGFCLPTHVEAGNFFGTPDYFPFYVADVASIRFPPPGA